MGAIDQKFGGYDGYGKDEDRGEERMMVGRDGDGCGKKEARNPSTGDWFRKEVKNKKRGNLPLVTGSARR